MSVIKTIMGAALTGGTGSSASPTYVDDVFSTYTYTGTGSTQTITNGIALGDSSIWSSENATALPAMTSGSTFAAAYGSGKYVATRYIAASPYITNITATSTDGVTWTAGSTGAIQSAWSAIARGTTNFVMASQYSAGLINATAVYSANGLSWSACSGFPTTMDTSAICYTNGIFFATLSNASGNATETIYQSTNEGVSWSAITGLPAGAWKDIAYGAGQYVMCNGNGSGTGFIYSTNLSTWTTVANAASMSGIKYGAGVFVATSGSGILTSSNAGSTWTTTLSGVNFNNLIFTGTTFVAVCTSIPGVYTSVDGITWTYRSTTSSTLCRWIASDGTGVVIGQAGADNRFVAKATSLVPAVIGKGGMVWTKSRSAAFSNAIQDTVRGRNNILFSDTTGANQAYTTSINSFNATGYTLGAETLTNQNTNSLVSWTFRKQPKFFDVVTFTGNGTTQNISHNLGSVPGMIIVKNTSSGSANWTVYHQSLTADYQLRLNLTNASNYSAGATWGNNTVSVSPTSTQFTVGSNFTVNGSGSTMVAYLFAHDTATDGLIQCGSFTQVSAGIDVTLGWEPQYILYKDIGTGGYDWQIVDSMRGFTSSTADKQLQPNTSTAENSNNVVGPIATGFHFDLRGGTYIYMAIRRPNKPPTTGTQVYNAIARTGTAAAATVTGVGFAPDLAVVRDNLTGQAAQPGWIDRLRGRSVELYSNATTAEYTTGATTDVTSFDMNGMSVGTSDGFSINNSPNTYINWFFKRAPGFFDEVCYTGTGATPNVLSHNLGVVPELMIVKRRDNVGDWAVYLSSLGNASALYLHVTVPTQAAASAWNSTTPSSTTFTLGNNSQINASGATGVAYLFATCPGVSKVGSYTGNGTSQTIACGFSAGARFVLVKRTDSTGDWFVFDTVRGIVTANDPHLSLNTTATEVTTDDSIDPASSGFIVNQVAATNINVTSATYIFLAIS